MLYSDIWQLRHRLSSCLVALLLSGCGDGAHNAAGAPGPTTLTDQINNNSVHQSTATAVTVSATGGGYVVDVDSTMFCDITNEFCAIRTESDSIELLTAVSRYGYRFNEWQYDGLAQAGTGTTLTLVAEADTSIGATFQKQDEISQPSCTASSQMARFRTLHLGDSLTAGQCWKTNCIPLFAKDTEESEREAIRFYETSIADNADAPRTFAVGGNRINGTNISLSTTGYQPSGFDADNSWQWSLNRHQESPEDFDAIVVALGTNDIADVFYDSTDIDSILENRIRPLLQWLGNKPIIWILPHYSTKPFSRGDVNLYSRVAGIACACGDNPPAAAECNLKQALEQCNATSSEAHDTIKIFKAVHAFRTRMLDLQNEYPNLRAIDAEQLIAEQSHGLYDLYQELKTDKLHFTPQGLEWYAWAHAYLGQSMNTACALPPPLWEMSAAENDMISRLQ